METSDLKRELPFWLLLLVPFIYAAYLWNQLPAQVPIHFGPDGEANDWASKPAVFLLPAIAVIVYLVLRFIRFIDPKKMSIEAFAGNFYKIRLTLSVFLFAFCLIVINGSVSGKLALGPRFTPAMAFLLLAVMGNFLINVKPNWFLGIRNPWTLSNESVWKKTHLLGGRIWFYGGIAGLIATFLAPDKAGTYLLIGFASFSVVFFWAYSYMLYKQEENQSIANQ